MEYTKENLIAVKKGLNKLAKENSRRINCSIPTELALDWGCSHGGTITCVSNQSGFYGFQGISINYSWGNKTPGSTAGHNMCFLLDSNGNFYSDDHWCSNTEENQKKLAKVFVDVMALILYGITPDELIKIGETEE